MTNEIIKKLWEQGITVEDYYYLLDAAGIGILSVPIGMANLEKLRSLGYLDKYAPTKKALDFIDDLQGSTKVRELFTEF